MPKDSNIVELDPDGDPTIKELHDELREVIYNRVRGTRVTMVAVIGTLHHLAYELSKELDEE